MAIYKGFNIQNIPGKNGSLYKVGSEQTGTLALVLALCTSTKFLYLVLFPSIAVSLAEKFHLSHGLNFSSKIIINLSF